MQKLILDTNVIISALISNSLPTKILYELVLTEKVELVLSEVVLSEYVSVMNRKKFSQYADFKIKADIVLNKLRDVSKLYYPKKRIELIKDIADNKFLELALESSADYLITGNTADFTFSEFEYTRILTPREYWELQNK